MCLINIADAVKIHQIVEFLRHSLRPLLKLGSAELKSVICVTELPFRQVRITRVVLAVRRRDDDVTRARKPKDIALQRRQAVYINVLDDLHQNGDIHIRDALIGIGHRRLEKLKPLCLALRHAVNIQRLASLRKFRQRDICADDLRNARILQQRPEQYTRAAPDIHHAARTQCGYLPQYALLPLPIQRLFVAFHFNITGELDDGFVDQPALLRKVAAQDFSRCGCEGSQLCARETSLSISRSSTQ